MKEDFESFTAATYIELERRRMRSLADLSHFRNVKTELRKRPRIQERLAFEFLNMTCHALDHGIDPLTPALHGFCLRQAITPERVWEYLEVVDTIINGSFDALGKVREIEAEAPSLAFTLTLALTTIRVMNFDRFCAVVANLRRSCGEADPRKEILIDSEASDKTKLARIRKLGRRAQRYKIELESAVRSHLN